MLKCEDCELFAQLPDGSPQLLCDPFSTIKEPECLAKWQLIQLRTIAEAHRVTLDMYRRLAPLQERLFRHVEREIDDADEADSWKYEDDEEDDEELP